MHEVTIKGLTLDPMTQTPILVLKDIKDNRALPIWIGLFEANAIALVMENVMTPRPMTHDLALNMLKALQATISRVTVTDIEENTFFAALTIVRDGHEIEVDARPSDAVALAIRAGAPIFVTDAVLEKSVPIEVEDGEVLDANQFRSWLENLKTEDFGKYSM